MSDAKLNKILKLLEQKAERDNWVCEETFSEKTGLKTVEQLRYFRKQHPDLVKGQKGDRVTKEKGDRTPRTINGPFIYNLQGWYELHQPLIKAS